MGLFTCIDRWINSFSSSPTWVGGYRYNILPGPLLSDQYQWILRWGPTNEITRAPSLLSAKQIPGISVRSHMSSAALMCPSPALTFKRVCPFLSWGVEKRLSVDRDVNLNLVMLDLWTYTFSVLHTFKAVHLISERLLESLFMTTGKHFMENGIRQKIIQELMSDKMEMTPLITCPHVILF